MRFTYSVITGSWISFTVDSTCWAYCLPIAICFSTPYQLPIPVLQPTLRLPTASTSCLPPLCFTFSGSASCTVACRQRSLDFLLGSTQDKRRRLPRYKD